MKNERLAYLFERYYKKVATVAETDELMHLLDTSADSEITPLMEKHFHLYEAESALYPVERERDLRKKVYAALHFSKSRRLTWKRWIPYAAALILTISAAIWLFIDGQSSQTNKGSHISADFIAAGSNKAVLALADGRTIDLRADSSGIVVGDRITYADGGLVLNADDPSTDYILHTPKGGTYQITLPDGTKVWLNALSSLKYPQQFMDSKRVVEVEGEAFFEVSKQSDAAGKRIPFIVQMNDQQIEVLGTQFNVSAYRDEAIVKTTLIEGSVQIQTGIHSMKRKLRPGEQAVLENGRMVVKPVDTAPYVAWKNGDFVFRDTPLIEVLRQLERWYAIEVDYNGIPDHTLDATVSRDTDLGTLLYGIEKVSDLTFQLKERRLRVMKQ